eukprot:1137554-Pelagomonas_calceolata.AAC.8
MTRATTNPCMSTTLTDTNTAFQGWAQQPTPARLRQGQRQCLSTSGGSACNRERNVSGQRAPAECPCPQVVPAKARQPCTQARKTCFKPASKTSNSFVCRWCLPKHSSHARKQERNRKQDLELLCLQVVPAKARQLERGELKVVLPVITSSGAEATKSGGEGVKVQDTDRGGGAEVQEKWGCRKKIA